jgi:transposase
MSQITIQCRLIAQEKTRQQLWQLMTQKNTPLINELLRQLANHPDFESWRNKGKIPVGTIKTLCQPLKTDPRYIGQPGRFYSSAIALVKYIYKSWLKLQKQLKYRLKAQQRWLAMLKSDEELVEESQTSLETIRATAKEILESLKVSEDSSLSNTLFEKFEQTKDLLALTRMEEKGDLNAQQQAFVKRKQTCLSRINNPFPRPNRPLYRGQTHIIVGISLGLEKPATAAVIDALSGKVITYRSTKQLLGDNYKLLNRQRRQKSFLSHQRHLNQKHQADNRLGESELGQYLDRLLAQAIIKLATAYQAGSIALPKLGDMREIVQSEIQALAEQKIPGYQEAQKRYAKQYKVNVHQWSYGRLMENIKAQAAKVGIAIEQSKQPIRGSPQDKAKEIAICAYSNRFNS